MSVFGFETYETYDHGPSGYFYIHISYPVCQHCFFRNITAVYTVTSENILFLASISVMLACLLIFALTLLCWKYTTRPFLILILIVSSMAAYFMDSYNVIIDDEMIQNVMQTDMNESLDLFSFKLLAYFLVLGILPAVYVYKVNIIHGSLKTELLKKLMLAGISFAMIAVMLFSFSRFYTSFFREHKPLREYANPPAWVYAVAKTIKNTFIENTTTVTPIGTDAKIPATDMDRELIILVVGEAVRADRLSLNGYFRETTPLLAKEDVISFSKMFFLRHLHSGFGPLYVFHLWQGQLQPEKRECHGKPSRCCSPRRDPRVMAGKQFKLQRNGPAGAV